MTVKTRAYTGGLEPRFWIERTDGKPIPSDRRYSLVLDFSGADPAARKTAWVYAWLVWFANRELARGIWAALRDPANAPPQHRYAK
jgi:hypothetical protein